MRPLIIDEAARLRAKEIMRYAGDHKERFIDLMRRINKPDACPGNDPGFVLNLFDGFKVVYTIEQQPAPMGWIIHISVGVDARDNKAKVANIAAVEHGILPLFGLKMSQSIHCYIEDISPVGENGIAQAVNLLFPFKPQDLTPPPTKT